ncbi:DNA-protecting protein DprA [bacterium]|nr:DNA-protecting protein DprA [bacterium]
MSSELYYQIALTQIPGIGSVLAKNLISYCGGVEAVFKQKESLLLKIPGIGLKLAKSIVQFKDFERVEQEIVEIENRRIQTRFFLDKDYPFRLKQIQDCPILLYKKGNGKVSSPKTIAIVGTRKITEYGRQFLKQFIQDIEGLNVTVFSGMAYGVDVLAHKECLKRNIPTVAVMAHGLDRVYPSLHLRIAEQMMRENGALITEYLTDTVPDRENFPKRNRIVAGLVDAVIVIESARKGGSLITAELANQYNREVLAVPGNVNSERSTGCNFLIKKNKAHLLESAADLIELMNWDVQFVQGKQQSLFVDLTDNEQAVVSCIRQFEEIGIDQLIANLDFTLSTLANTLLSLELKNCISSLPGKRYKLC